MTVVLAGCGDLGTEIGLRFAGTGRRVLGLRRRTDVLPPQIAGLRVDLAHEVPTLPDDTETVVVVLTADRRTADGYRTTYLRGLTHVLDSLNTVQAQPRVLLVSSTAVYGVNDGSWVDEDTPAEPRSATGRVLLEVESELLRRRPGATILRLTGLYGPGRGRMIERVRAGTVEEPTTPTYTNRIHRDDAAAAVLHLATAVTAPDSVYVGVDDAPVERSHLLRFLADELGVEAPPSDEGDAAPGGKRFRNTLLRATGFEFAYPTYREGYRAVLAGNGTRHP
ncbi:SDR family NAD(P)-dependent oxidoreductase [Allosaccharopolyspora coralli]|uniref:SDR family NAD(P)-dependent oxidoreductase n=1 Tax=Allosaccharopolyspora coralli TaxID=2665642 RepID=A0A5Q3QBA1_9PSEU|nr:NAD-dependent epimerase/dehydratase family protein [Allosaccharopolyspora coralli]QGK70494.1 SDR family NAD(P)-dependent oxidoreductase [Allosaccharopolyspora coralli]